MKFNHVKISDGNSKLGKIANFSLTPGKTCTPEACATCLKEGCYALNSYKCYKTCRAAWDFNTEQCATNLDAVRDELTQYFASLNAPKYFRLHVGGDFFSAEYAKMWADVARNAPGTRFLAFTKAWDAVRAADWPENFSVVLSAWPGILPPADLAINFSTAYMDDGTNGAEIPANAIPCPGNCETCGVCWGLARAGLNVVFEKHGKHAKKRKGEQRRRGNK